MIKTMIALGSAALIAGCATTGQMAEAKEDPALTKALAGKAAGPPKTCLSLIDARQSDTYDGTILYRVSRNLTYRNDLNGCGNLGYDRIPVVQVYGSQICRGDIVRMVDRTTGSEWGACSFGDFVPYRTVESGSAKGR